MNKNERFIQAKKITLLGAFKNIFLGFLKTLGGIFFHSHALIADGIHSFADLLADFLVLMASKFGSNDADLEHPYGHQRIETAATLILSLFLVITGVGIAYDAIFDYINSDLSKPLFWSLPIIVCSILLNEILFHYTKHIGFKIYSDLIITNAWHHRADAFSSFIVLIGILGSFAGLYVLDIVAAFLIGGLIIKMGISYGWNSVKVLVDTGVDTVKLEKIKAFITDINGVKCIHQLRSRMMEKDIYIDVHVLVAPKISVSEGHFIAQNVHRSLVKYFPDIKDVTVHVDPEDDEEFCPSLLLPNRKSLEDSVTAKLKENFTEIYDIVLHYLDGTIEIQLLCREPIRETKLYDEHIQNILTQYEEIKKIETLLLVSEICNL